MPILVSACAGSERAYRLPAHNVNRSSTRAEGMTAGQTKASLLGKCAIRHGDNESGVTQNQLGK